jgi:hypothetical protein
MTGMSYGFREYADQVADSYQATKAASMVGKDMLKPDDRPYTTIDEIAYNPVKKGMSEKPGVADPSSIAKILRYSGNTKYKIV